MALQVDRISDLIEKINHGNQQLAAGDTTARLSMLQWTWNLAQALENPFEGIMRLLLVDVTTSALVRLGSRVKLFEHLSEDKSQAVTSYELAEKTGVEGALLCRFLRHLAASGIIREAGPDRYFACAMTTAIATKKYQDIMRFLNIVHAPALSAIPEFFADNGYRELSNGARTPIQMTLGTDLHIFEYIKGNPELARLFQIAVLSQEGPRRAHWDDPKFYPVRERLLSGLHQEEGSVVMVDVAGGMGLDSIGFHDTFSDLSGGRLVLQETEQILSMVDDLPSTIEKMAHDFFKPQPVKGARAYYFHHILHDWSDDKCREILLALRPALTPEYSKVLIQDNVVPSEGASWLSTTSDLIMMAGLAGKERTRAEFEALFESVGMKVTGVWNRAPNEESVVEAIFLE